MGKLLMPPLAVFLSVALLAPSPHEPAAEQASPVYVALGDSLAFGVGASDPSARGYVALTAAGLRESERYRERGLQLLNLGVPGATSADLLVPGGQIETALDEIEQRSLEGGVELITIDIGGNDILSLAEPDSPCVSDAAAEPCRQRFGEVLSGLQQNLTGALESLREAAPDVPIIVVDLYNPYSGTGDLREPLADVAVGHANGVIGAAAANPDLDIRMATVYQTFQGRGGQWIAADGIHPNDTGYSVMGEFVLAQAQERSAVIPDEILAQPPGPTSGFGGGSASSGVIASSEDGGVSTTVLVASVAVAFVAGLLVSGAYFMVRSR